VGAVGLLDLLAELIGDKGGAVEGDVVAILLLPPYPVAGHQRHQVGPSMALLHPLPVILGSNGRIMGLAADGGGIEENLRALQRHGPGALREPLVPADPHAYGGIAGLPDLEPGIAGVEVVLLVV